MKSSRFLSLCTALTLCALPVAMRAGTVQGTVLGSTATAGALAFDPNVRDDTDTSTTMDILFFTYCPYIVNGATAFPAYNFVFAGFGVAAAIPNIDASDFTISNYRPWVVDSNATTN